MNFCETLNKFQKFETKRYWTIDVNKLIQLKNSLLEFFFTNSLMPLDTLKFTKHYNLFITNSEFCLKKLIKNRVYDLKLVQNKK